MPLFCAKSAKEKKVQKNKGYEVSVTNAKKTTGRDSSHFKSLLKTWVSTEL